MIDPHQISSDLAQEAFTDALRRHVGLGKDWPVEKLSEATGIDQRTLRAYHTGENAPCLHKLLRIGAALGPAFMSDVLAPAGMGGVERIGAAESNAQIVAGELVEKANEILKRLADGVFDHRDKLAVAPLLSQLAALLEQQSRAMCEEARPRKVVG